MAESYDPRQKSIMAEIREAAERIMVVARNAEMIEGRGAHHYDMLKEDIRRTEARIYELLGELRDLWTRLEEQGTALRTAAALQGRNLGSALMDIKHTLGGIVERIEGSGGKPWQGRQRQRG